MNKPSISHRLQTMIGAAQAAGNILLMHLNLARIDLGIADKGVGDLVSDADRASEQVIAGILDSTYPGYRHLREESGAKAGADSGAPLWIYDPLDGTKNFLQRGPNWSVSIALEQDNEIVAAVTVAPRLREIFFAEKGKGAWLCDLFNNKADLRRLSVYDGDRIEKGVIETYPQSRFLGDADAFYRATGSEVRTIGTTCLDLAYIADGRYQAFVKEAGFGPWDLAAGALMVREAGGVVTGLDGSDDFIRGKTVVAANKPIHAQIMQRVKQGAGNVFS